MSEEKDPLDELREIAKTTQLIIGGEAIERIADAWQAERDEHEKSLSYATSRWKNACDNVEATAASRDEWRKRARAAEKAVKDCVVDRDGWSDRCAELETELSKKQEELDEVAQYIGYESENDITDGGSFVSIMVMATMQGLELRAEDAERERDDLKSKLHSTEVASIELQSELRQENADLKARLDASMPLPLDADGVPCRIGDEMEFNKTRFSVVGYRQCDADGSLLIFGKGLNAMCSESCHHVTPKPETIDYVRDEATTCADCREPIDLVNRAYECGVRKGIEEQQVHASFEKCAEEHRCGTCGIEETGRCDCDEGDAS